MTTTAHGGKPDKFNLKDFLLLFSGMLLTGLAGWLGNVFPKEREWLVAALVLAFACIAVAVVAVYGYLKQTKETADSQTALSAAIQSFGKAEGLVSERLQVLKQAINYALKVEESDLLTASEIRQQEEQLPPNSHVTIVNPSHTIEIEKQFIEVVKKNLERDISYAYIVHQDAAPLIERLNKEFLQIRGNPRLASRIKIRKVPVTVDGEIIHVFNVLCHYTMGVYHLPNSQSFVFLVAPGFDPQCAIRLPPESSAVSVRSVESYIRFLDDREKIMSKGPKKGFAQGQGKR